MIGATALWHLQGTCTWVASLMSLSLGVLLAFTGFRKSRPGSKAAIYAVLIALCGIISTVMEQRTFIKEQQDARFMPEWVRSLKKFSLSSSAEFLETFFRTTIDLLITSDLFNLYILICVPQKKEEIMGNKAVGAQVSVILGVSILFSALSCRMQVETETVNLGGGCIGGQCSFGARYSWISLLVLKMLYSLLIVGFQVFGTYKIRQSLQKAIRFLWQSQNSLDTVRLYSRIHRFCFVLCLFLVFYNFFVEMANMGTVITRQIVLNNGVLFSDLHVFLNSMHLVEHLLKILVCFKPCCYGATYFWLHNSKKDERND